MVLPVGLRHRLETQIAVILATVIGKLLHERRPVLALRRDDVDMRDPDDGGAAEAGRQRADRQREMDTLVVRRVLDRLEPVVELGRVRRLGVRVE